MQDIKLKLNGKVLTRIVTIQRTVYPKAGFLFTTYIDVLLNRLKENGIGCWIGDSYFGALSYANVIFILSPTLKDLQEMLNVCNDFGKEYDVILIQ